MKKAIITGASSGLGHEIALKLIEKGVNVINLSRTESKLNVINIKTDLTKHEEILNAINQIKKEHSDIDLLILNSGVMHRHFVGETPLEEIDNDFSVNVTSSIKIIDSLISLIKENKGDIVIIGSTSAFQTHRETSVYNSAKHAILGYIKSLQTEMKKENVRVIGFHPGGFKSQLHIKAGSDLKQEDLMDPKYLANTLMSILDLPRSLQISEIIIDRKKIAPQ
jgi:short-subunit dehydrogenase